MTSPEPRSSEAADRRSRSNEAAIGLWDSFPVGSHRSNAEVGSRQFFADVEAYRYGYETPWIPRIFDFASFSGKKVLEIGVGLGIDAATMCGCGAIYTGIDVTRRHLDLAAKNLEDRGFSGEFIQGDVTETRLPEKFYDVVYSFGVLHHIPHEDEVLRRIRTLLREDGRLMLAVYSKYSFFNAYMLLRWILSGSFLNHRLDAFRSHLAEGSPLESPVTIRIRSKSEVLSTIRKNFGVVRYHKKGFVQRYLPVIGRFLKPDGLVLGRLGSLFGWYHVFILKVKGPE